MNNIPIVSFDYAKASCSNNVPLPLNKFFDLAPKIEGVVRKTNDVDKPRYDQYGESAPDYSRLMPDDLDAALSALGIDPVQDFGPIVAMPFVVEENVKHKEDVARVLNSPIITALNSYHSYFTSMKKVNILILCAGNGEDLCRLAYYDMLSNASVSLVGASGLNSRATLAKNMVRHGFKATPKYLRDVPPDWFEGPYDLILAHHGLHHLYRTQADQDHFEHLVSQHLASEGIVLADRISQTGLRTLESLTYQPGNHVEFLGPVANSTSLEGEMSVRIGTKKFVDPILSDQRLEVSLTRAGMQYSIFEGKGIFSGLNRFGGPLTVPKNLKRDAFRSDGKIMSLIQMWKGPLAILPSTCSGPSTGWVSRPTMPSKDYMSIHFPINKGITLAAHDAPYVAPDSVYYSEKSNGVSSQVIITEGNAWLLTHHEPARIYFAGTLPRLGLGCVRLQCEYVEVGEGFQVVLNEVISYPGSHGVGFASRWNYWLRLCRDSPDLEKLVHAKTQFTHWSQASMMCKADNWEGVVFNWINARSPMDGDIYTRSARYLKIERTIDIKDPGSSGVYEVTLSGRIVRLRNDKATGNSHHAINEILKGCDVEVWDVVSEIGYDSGDPEQALKYIYTHPEGPEVGMVECLNVPDTEMAKGCLRLMKYPFQHVQVQDQLWFQTARAKFVDMVLTYVSSFPPGDGLPYKSIVSGDYDFISGAWRASPVESFSDPVTQSLDFAF